MAAKNPRWPPRNSVFWHFRLINFRKWYDSKNKKKTLLESPEPVEIKSSQSNNFWVSYGPLKYVLKHARWVERKLIINYYIFKHKTIERGNNSFHAYTFLFKTIAITTSHIKTFSSQSYLSDTRPSEITTCVIFLSFLSNLIWTLSSWTFPPSWDMNSCIIWKHRT